MKKSYLSRAICFAITSLFTFASFAASDWMTPATPESQGVSSAAISKWIQSESELDAVHSFVLVRHGRLIAQGAWAPYDLNRRHQLYSHSKSFTATAIGFLIDDRRLDLDTLLVSIFPEKFPENADPKVLALRVRDLLTMNTGFDGSDTPFYNTKEPDWVKSFLATKPGVAPGTRFRYDTAATYVLAAIVEKISGQPMMDFLNERLFRPLNFGDIYSTVSPTGIACGGYGIYARTPDLAKFGLLYLNEGNWDGTRILSRDWVRLATAKQTKSGFPPADSPVTDWTSGYGFQFWRCTHNAYRADGSHGQYTIVMPDQDAVLSVTSCMPDMKQILNRVWAHLLPAMQKDALPENPVAHAQLNELIQNLTLPVPTGDACPSRPISNDVFHFKNNHRGYESVQFETTAKGLVCHLTLANVGTQSILIGDKKWAKGSMWVAARDLKYEAIGHLIGEQPIVAAGAWTDPNTLAIKILFTDQAHRLELRATLKDGSWSVSGNHIGLRGCALSAK